MDAVQASPKYNHWKPEIPIVGPVSVFSVRDGQDNICEICREQIEFAVGNVVVANDATQDGTATNPVRCGHKFHLECVLEYVEKNRKCPICREHIRIISPSIRM